MVNTNEGARPTKIGRVEAAKLIMDSKGKFFTVAFKKKNGDLRTMNCRKGVTKGIKGTKKPLNVETLGYTRVYEMAGKKGGYKMVNLQTLTGLKINKQIYEIK